jgi:hypothetical protein
MTSFRKTDYRNYLASITWAERRRRRLIAAGHRCEFVPCCEFHDDGPRGPRCAVTENLEVHHRSYERLGAELDTDLEVLCRFHHRVRHCESAVCELCEEFIFAHQQDAIAWVEEMGDWPPNDFCDYHEHVFTKDD